MEKRIELGKKLKEILGNTNTYYQPPESTKIKYPAIMYSLDGIEINHADDIKYAKRKRYSVILIDYNVDSEYVYKILDTFEYCSFERFYVADNLNHWAFTLFY